MKTFRENPIDHLNSMQTGQLNPLFHTYTDLIRLERGKTLIGWCLISSFLLRKLETTNDNLAVSYAAKISPEPHHSYVRCEAFGTKTKLFCINFLRACQRELATFSCTFRATKFKRVRVKIHKAINARHG